jgi:type IV secretion system protein VirB6
MYNIDIGKISKIVACLFTQPVLSNVFFNKILQKTLAAFLVINFLFVQGVKAESTMETIFDNLQSITCETEGIGDLLKPEFAHTCIPAPFFTFLIANIVSPGLYANTLLRLHMNDDELFPGACYRENRADFSDPRISFSMCNNTKLMTVRADALKDTVVAITYSFITGKNPWEEIKKSWKLDKSEYHNIYSDKKEGDEGVMWDIGVIPYFPWKVVKKQDRICVATQGFSGWIPVGCKFIKEPFPISIYADFMDLSTDGIKELENLTSLTTCGTMGSCYKRAYENSRTGIVMTGPLIECVKEMVAKLTISNAVCSFDDVNTVLSSSTRYTSSLFLFQKHMHTAVSALLTIYIILFGFKMLLTGDAPPKSELVTFVIKFIFVVYFSVGININSDGGSELDRLDGMIQWAFPFLLSGMTELAGWMVSASPSGLCDFTDVHYPDGLEHLQLWDTLDCKVSHYLGLDVMQTMVVENAQRHHDLSRFDILSFPIPPYIFLLVPAVITGNFILISLALMYPLMVISVAAFVVNATVVCMISIVILGVLAPLFVPMYLFEYTKGYFEAWVKLLISFLLQPMVAIVFLTTMMAIYDYGYYGTCKYETTDFSYGGAKFTVTMDAGIAGASATVGDRVVRYSYVDQNWDHYTEKEAEGCQNSLGFILNNPLQFAFSSGKDLASAQMPWLADSSGDEEKKRFDFLDAIMLTNGMFFSSYEVMFEKIKILVIALFTASFALYLMYHFSESLAEFAADMTEGVSLSNMAIKPQSIFKAGMAAVSASNPGTAASTDKAATSRGGATDKFATGEGLSSDKVATGRGGATDKVSKGDGEPRDKA